MSGKRVEVPRKSVTVTARYRLIFGGKALRQPEFFWILLCIIEMGDEIEFNFEYYLAGKRTIAEKALEGQL